MMIVVMYRFKLLWFMIFEVEEIKFIDRILNVFLVGVVILYVFIKIVIVDYDVWYGWIMFEVLKYVFFYNWYVYEEVFKSNLILVKMMISGIVYLIGDWIG